MNKKYKRAINRLKVDLSNSDKPLKVKDLSPIIGLTVNQIDSFMNDRLKDISQVKSLIDDKYTNYLNDYNSRDKDNSIIAPTDPNSFARYGQILENRLSELERQVSILMKANTPKTMDQKLANDIMNDHLNIKKSK